jgi:hypothetical protein
MANLNDRDGWMVDNVRATVEICTGGIEEDPLSAVSVAPNPATNEVVLSSMPPGVELLQFFRSDGSLVQEVRPSSAPLFAMDLTTWSEGLYLVRLVDGSRSVTRSLVVQR